MSSVALHPAQQFRRSGRRPLRRDVRRRTLARVLAILALAVALALFLPRMVRVLARPAALPAPVHVTVQPGDTLWSIASQHAGGADIRRAIWEIRRANGLESGTIQPGMVLTIPGGRKAS